MVDIDRAAQKSEEEQVALARQIIGGMDENTFTGFQRELQHLQYTHRAGADRATLIMVMGDVPDSQKDRVIALQVDHKTSAREVSENPLYAEVRTQINKRELGEVDNNWTGWLLDSEEEHAEVVKAIATQIANTKGYGIYGLITRISSDPTPEENIKAAKDKLETKYGIKGVFQESDDLVSAFLDNWS